MLSRRSTLIAAIAIAASSAALAPSLAAGPQNFDSQAFANAQKAGKPILVAIHSSRCSICQAQILSEVVGRADVQGPRLFHDRFRPSEGSSPTLWREEAINADYIQRTNRPEPIGRGFEPSVNLGPSEHGALRHSLNAAASTPADTGGAGSK